VVHHWHPRKTQYVAPVAVPAGAETWWLIVKWCFDQYGDTGTWRYDGEGVFVFDNDQDYALFLLRWA